MAFELPPLPYAYEALQPYMSAETLQYHHDKHHKAYVDNLNKLLPGSGFEGKSLEDIVKASYGKNAGVFNNAAQDFNHIHFWPWMKKGGGGKKVPGSVLALIDRDLGGFDKFRNDFIEAGKTQFGSGWAWLAIKDGKLEITKTPNGENPLVTAAGRCSASMCGSTLITSTIATSGRNISKPGSTISSTGTMSRRCSRSRRNSARIAICREISARFPRNCVRLARRCSTLSPAYPRLDPGGGTLGGLARLEPAMLG